MARAKTITPTLLRAMPHDEVQKYIRYLRNGNEEAFESELTSLLADGTQKELAKKPAAVYRIGFHYISPTFGKWMRVYHDPATAGNPFRTRSHHIEMYVHSRSYSQVMPRNRNLLVHPGLQKSLLIQLGGIACASDVDLHIPAPQLKDLADLVERGFANETPQQAFLFSFLPNAPDFSGRLAASHKELCSFLQMELGPKIMPKLIAEEKVQLLKRAYSLNDATLQPDAAHADVWIRYLLDIVLFSFFPSIRVLQGTGQLFIRLVPYRVASSDLSDDPDGELFACAAVAGATTDKTKALDSLLHDLISDIAFLDLRVASERLRPAHCQVRAEEVIRDCCSVDEVTFRYVNQFPRWLCMEFERLKNRIPSLCQGRLLQDSCGDSGCPPDKMKDCAWHFLCYHGDERVVAASRVYLDALKEIEQKAEAPAAIGEKGKVRVLYLYSAPGAGKEQLARFFHLCCQNESSVPTLTAEASTFFAGFDQPDRLLSVRGLGPLDEHLSARTSLISEARQKEYLFFNYFPVNAGLVNDRNLPRVLFGRTASNQIGILSQAHFWSGTTFLDEFNTMRPVHAATQLLRVFEKPYEGYIEEGSASLKLNLNVVIAGNLDRQGLLNAQFSPPIVFRICKNQVTVPSLCERPEDTAVFVLHRCIGKNRDFRDKGKESQCIHHIEPAGLRLICRLPWETNYRGLVGFMDDLLSYRDSRGIISGKITYEEILEGLARNQLLSGKTMDVKEDAYYARSKK